MFELRNNTYPFHSDVPSAHIEKNYHVRQYFIAQDLFEQAMVRGKLYRFWASISRRPQRLLDLATLKPKMHTANAHYSGLKNIPINQIIGTEQGTSNFDLAFHPVSERSRERWIGVATASLNLLPLPIIELIQIGNAYFVRDGHHRISVARALKQEFIEAEVTTWGYSWKHAPDAAVNLLAYQMNGC